LGFGNQNAGFDNGCGTMPVISNLKRLYETDDVQWLAETVELLKQRQFEELDLDNLIEELEDLGSEKKNAKVYQLEGEQASAVLISQANYESLSRNYRITLDSMVEGQFTKIIGAS
jgi:hypothetical protein